MIDITKKIRAQDSKEEATVLHRFVATGYKGDYKNEQELNLILWEGGSYGIVSTEDLEAYWENAPTVKYCNFYSFSCRPYDCGAYVYNTEEYACAAADRETAMAVAVKVELP